VRELRALEPCRLSLVGERRGRSPGGAAGGEPGAAGRNFVNGKPVPGKTTLDLEGGDVVRVETPGGGGFGHVRNGH
jgi:N-methylhydantoinase B/oxoprolinase/acetone carboxylase alpha subunit